MTIKELREMAKAKNVAGYYKMNKAELESALAEPETVQSETVAEAPVDYAAQRAARGTEEFLARLVKPCAFKTTKDGAEIAIFRLARWDKEKQDTEFLTATAYIKSGKDSLKNWYASLGKGQLVSVEMKRGQYNNIFNMFDRSELDKKRQAAAVADTLEA